MKWKPIDDVTPGNTSIDHLCIIYNVHIEKVLGFHSHSTKSLRKKVIWWLAWAELHTAPFDEFSMWNSTGIINREKRNSYRHITVDCEMPLFPTREALHKTIKLKTLRKERGNLTFPMIWLLKTVFPQSIREPFKENPADQNGGGILGPNKNYAPKPLYLLVNQKLSIFNLSLIQMVRF